MTIDRHSVLKHNQLAREGRAPVRKLDDGEVAFKIPEEDFKVLKVIYPDLVSHDFEERHQAWKDFRNSPLGVLYLVQRAPAQVRRSHKNRIIIK